MTTANETTQPADEGRLEPTVRPQRSTLAVECMVRKYECGEGREWWRLALTEAYKRGQADAAPSAPDRPLWLPLNDGLGAWGRDDLMALAAVRYCLGRMSYIVGDCTDWLQQAWPRLKPATRTVIARDIDEAIRRDTEARARGDEHLPLGMDYDRAAWVSMQHLWRAPNVRAKPPKVGLSE